MLSESKLDDSLPPIQIHIKGFVNPIRLDRKPNGGSILVFVHKNILFKHILMKNSSIEGFFIKLNLKRKKWLVCCSYSPHDIDILNLLNSTGSNLGLLTGNYENIFLMGDFICKTDNVDLKDFCNLFNLKSLIKVPTCFKNATNPTCIDLMLRNSYEKLMLGNSFYIKTLVLLKEDCQIFIR